MPTLKIYTVIPEGVNHESFVEKNGLKISSKFNGVVFKAQKKSNGGLLFYWTCRINRNKIKFAKNFPFTERGEQLAGQAYQKIINKLYSEN